jgi:hypothetical protein
MKLIAIWVRGRKWLVCRVEDKTDPRYWVYIEPEGVSHEEKRANALKLGEVKVRKLLIDNGAL